MLVDIGKHIKQQCQTEGKASSCFAALLPAENTMRTATLMPGLRTRARHGITNSPGASDMPNNQPIKTNSKKNRSVQTAKTSGVTLKISASTLLYTIAFIEGGAVMAIELAGAKPLAALSGSSLIPGRHADVLTNGSLPAAGIDVYINDNLNLN